MSNLPSTKPFQYICIPAQESNPVYPCQFKGNGEQELREELSRHFRTLLLSDEQKAAMSQHILFEAEKSSSRQEAEAKKLAAKFVGEKDAAATGEPSSSHAQVEEESNRVVEVVDGEEEEGAVVAVEKEEKNEEVNPSSTTTSAPAPPPPVSKEVLIDQFLESNAFEVVPITMPTRETKFIARSLYVDDCGQFKNLPLNCRASKLAKREIRGDAFLLSNHDDPALEDWERVDTTVECYEDLYQNSDKLQALDTSNQSQMMAITQCREDQSKKIAEEEVVKAIQAKMVGNSLVAKGDWKAAAESYKESIELTTGRRDLLKDEAAATALHISSRLNRSLCFAKMRKFESAVEDARWVLSLEPKNLKGMYRLAQGEIGLQEYGQASKTLDAFIKEGGSEEDRRVLQQAINEGAQALREKEKKMYGKMFAS